ncbi:magnesium transporter [Luteimonas terricola]|uniref:Magnesium transporter MgtE n=1 Tax=Luteimonas terricola TaxID=645597 RepID=A0ABQ2E4N0_9GAMM|nr:magnesium transporter [Luteimonas terricola]GGJ95697.1 magnesium transporter MgtE [Luteimonas terricola]
MIEHATRGRRALHLVDAQGDFDADKVAAAIAVALDTDPAGLQDALDGELAADLADALTRLGPRQQAAMLALIAADERALVFGYLPLKLQTALAAGMSRPAVLELFDLMSADERVDLFNTLPPDRRERLLPALAQAEREDIRRLASYPRDSVGALMTSEYATLTPELTAGEAIAELRRVAPDKETIYNAYVIDHDRRLVGVATLRRLILAAPDMPVSEVMASDPVTVFVDADQYEAASKIARYDFIALPVIDRERRIVGIVTADDAMDVAEAEATEDFHKAGGSLGTLTVSMKDAGIGLLYRQRVFWLVLLVFANLFSGAGIAHFEDLIAANLALVFFLPLLIASGGNAGAQSATLMVRAIATGDVEMRDWAGMLGREFIVSTLLGLTMALAVSAIGLFRGGPEIAIVVATTMLLIVLVGSVMGMSLPFLLSRFRADPASASSPLITSLADGVGILIYFGIATVMLSWLGQPA